MKRLALLPLLALAACTPGRIATEAMLTERGVVGATVSAEPWLLGPCGWSETYTAHFAGRFGGHAVTGTVCSTSENLEDARLLDVRRPWPQRGRS